MRVRRAPSQEQVITFRGISFPKLPPSGGPVEGERGGVRQQALEREGALAALCQIQKQRVPDPFATLRWRHEEMVDEVFRLPHRDEPEEAAGVVLREMDGFALRLVREVFQGKGGRGRPGERLKAGLQEKLRQGGVIFLLGRADDHDAPRFIWPVLAFLAEGPQDLHLFVSSP